MVDPIWSRPGWLASTASSNAPESSAGASPEELKLEQACIDFETIFLETILKSARASAPKDGLFSSREEDMFRDMLDAEMAKSIASARGIGLAEFIKKDIIRKQR